MRRDVLSVVMNVLMRDYHSVRAGCEKLIADQVRQSDGVEYGQMHLSAFYCEKCD